MAELRKSMKTHLDYVSKDSGTIIIPRKSGQNSVVMISEDEYNAMQETLYLMSSKQIENVWKNPSNSIKMGMEFLFLLYEY